MTDNERCGKSAVSDDVPCNRPKGHYRPQDPKASPHRMHSPYGNGDWIEYAETVLDGQPFLQQVGRSPVGARMERQVALANERERMAPRRFTLVREADVSGVSGTGNVASGVRFEDGSVVIRWAGPYASTVNWASLEDAMVVHGHGGKTQVLWMDAPPGDTLL